MTVSHSVDGIDCMSVQGHAERSQPSAGAAQSPAPAVPEQPEGKRKGKPKGKWLLTDKEVTNEKPRAEPFKVSDGNGLYLYVATTGSKSFRWDYRYQGRRQTLTYGEYGVDITLATARTDHECAKCDLHDGKDPRVRLQQKRAVAFETVAPVRTLICATEACFRYHREQEEKGLAVEGMRGKRPIIGGKPRKFQWEIDQQRIGRYLYGNLGKADFAAITQQQLTDELLNMVGNGRFIMAKRVRSAAEKVWTYGVMKRWVASNIAAGIKLKNPNGARRGRKHFAAIKNPLRFGQLLREIDDYGWKRVRRTEPAVRLAWQATPLTLLRNSELLWMKWPWIEWSYEFKDDGRIVVPASVMKRSEDHWIPLTRQLKVVVLAARKWFGRREYVFPSLSGEPLSAGTLNKALRRMKFEGSEHTHHGTRQFFDTKMHELLWHHDSIEICLAHAVVQQRSETEACYNHAKYWPLRKILMQWWADWLDVLKGGVFTRPEIPWTKINAALAMENFMYEPTVLNAVPAPHGAIA